ncbi:MAG: GIY-YIG nuclease family protein [Verrucomicrobiota bacterium JB022]|nr:GIY-YIG nuclease family protein [Verrucomicrobiota bacterium JB022]
MDCYVYILQNPAGRFYIGQSTDLVARLESHNSTDCSAGKYTRKNGPWELVWQEAHPDRSSAVRREREIKAWKSAARIRRELLSGRVPPRRD